VARAWARLAARCEERLYNAIFQRVKRHDDESTAGPQRAFGGEKAALQFAKLIVDQQAQGLEGAGRRVNLAGFGAHDPCHDVGERRRGLDWLARALRHDRARDRARVAFLAQRADDECKVAFGRLGHHVGGARPVAPHPHVQRSVQAEREPALGRIELHGRNPEVEDDAVRLLIAGNLGECREPVFHQLEPTVGALDQIGAVCDRGLVAVDADDLAISRG
jgi:hypothetical protein